MSENNKANNIEEMVPMAEFLAVKAELEQMKLYNQAKANRVKQLKKQVRYMKTVSHINKIKLRETFVRAHETYKNYYKHQGRWDCVTDSEYARAEGKEDLADDLLRGLDGGDLFTRSFY